MAEVGERRLKLTVMLNLEQMSKELIVAMILQEADWAFQIGRSHSLGLIPEGFDYHKELMDKYYE